VALDSDRLDKIKELMLERRIQGVPALSIDGKITKFYTFEDILSESDIHLVKKRIDIPVVIMAGGKGRRLKPFTDILPKPLIPVGDRPITEKIMDIFHSYGVKDFFVTLNYKAKMVEAYFAESSFPYNVNLIKEENPTGTIGSLSLLKHKLGSTFFVTNCDIIVDADFTDVIEFHRREKNILTMICSMKNFKIPYGIVHHESNGRFTHMQEKPEMDFLVNTGVYVIEPEALKNLPEGVEYDMNLFIEKLEVDGGKIGIYPVSDRSWFDVGQWENYYDSMEKLNNMGRHDIGNDKK
jgi:NDP-sugar pyrophosphorylase family protein